MTAYLGTAAAREFIVPQTPQADQAVGWNFERFDGISEPPLDHPRGTIPQGPTAVDPVLATIGIGGDPGFDGARIYGPSRVPGMAPTPNGTEYSVGPLSGVVGVLGGQPLPVSDRIHAPAGNYTPAGVRRIGGPKAGRQGYQGVAQTVILSEITGNPPEPNDLTSILAGYG